LQGYFDRLVNLPYRYVNTGVQTRTAQYRGVSMSTAMNALKEPEAVGESLASYRRESLLKVLKGP